MLERPFFRFLYKWRVRTAFVAFIITIVLARPTPVSLAWGVALCLAGLAIRVWASGHLRKEKKLATSGPYRLTRNPLYLGSLLLGISIVVGSRSWWVLGIFAIYFLLFYPVVILTEKERMTNLFPDEYGEYARNVPLFFPYRKSWPARSGQKFDWMLYRKNKEHRAFIGAAVYWVILAARLIFHI